jgi:hypothetical protein
VWRNANQLSEVTGTDLPLLRPPSPISNRNLANGPIYLRQEIIAIEWLIIASESAARENLATSLIIGVG